MHLPNSAAEKTVAHPHKALSYVYQNFILDPLSNAHSSILSNGLDTQPVRLARLRAKEDFCLVVLDACRYDFLNSEFDDFFYGDCEPIWATALNTFQYLHYLWPETYEYPYISAAAPVTSQQFKFEEDESADGITFSGDELLEKYCGYVPNNHLKNLTEVWRESWDEELGVCPPEPVTEAAIEASESADEDRLVAHYFQPHSPFIGTQRLEEANSNYDESIRGGAIDGEVWSAAQKGDLNQKQLRKFYRSNLRRALASVTELIRETDYERYVIVGDHGEALGEYDQYYHGIDHPKVRHIPWAIIDGVRRDAPEMWDYSSPGETLDRTTKSRLEELGYVESSPDQ